MRAARHGLLIDFNADLGEAATPQQQSTEDRIIRSVSSVNIACGGHAGDEATMRHAVRSAERLGVAIGAHPSYPDRAGFGRRRLDIDPNELRDSLADQITALAAIASAEGASLVHCKPHGALYHAASQDELIARAIHDACVQHSPELRIVGRSGSRAVSLWNAWGTPTLSEAFADRVYECDGSLRPRDESDALILDPEQAAEQALMIARDQTVRCGDGRTIPLTADTICVHADTPGAAAIAAHVADSLRTPS